MRTQRQTLAETKAAYNHPTYAKMAFTMGCGVQGRGEGCHVYDETGRPFLALFDQYGNQSFGYSHERLVQALRDRLDTANLNSTKILFEEVQIRLSERLARLSDGHLRYSYLANGGGESIDNALKLARAATGRPYFVTAVDCFHGKTIATLSASRRPEHEAVYRPLMSEFRQVPFGDIAAMEAAVDENTAAVLLEPVQAEGGVIVPSEDYLREVRRICTERGALLILDEMQTAFGRCGTFFAHQQFGVLPDLVCIGKAFGGGLLPISAVLGTAEVWTSLKRTPSTFGSSLGGNPLSCSVGLAAVELASEPEFLARVNARAEQIQRRLTELPARFPKLVRAHRGLGMMHGLEFHDEALGGLVLRLLIRHQVTSTYSLYNNSVLRVQPPMVIGEAELDRGLDVLEEVLAEVEAYQAGGGATGVDAMSPQRLSVELPYPAPAVRELLGRRPRSLDPFSLHPEQEDCPPVEPEFAGTLGEDPVVWEDHYAAGPDGPVLSAGDCWMWTSLRRGFTVVPSGGTACRVDIDIEWDAGTGGYEALLAGGISWFVATRVEQLADEIRKHLAE
ncbi:aspartate aminotransferase family protein [Streptomyces sp. NPDC127190]|uniref:aspartate aminotransferase family protein n=1 Tax=unclassified Streptomyces TaxID=2593676 RepID=UPI00362D4745